MAQPSFMYDGHRYFSDWGHKWRVANPKLDRDAYGEPVEGNRVVIVRLQNCVVDGCFSKEALEFAPCLKDCVYLADNKIRGPIRQKGSRFQRREFLVLGGSIYSRRINSGRVNSGCVSPTNPVEKDVQDVHQDH